MNNEEFLAEMKRRREEAEAAKGGMQSMPGTEGAFIKPDAAYAGSEKGLIGLLIKHGVAKDPRQANQILLGALAVAVLFIIWFNFF